MSLSSWGKCTVYIKDLDATTPKWKKLHTPAEGTTTLETTKGEKKEAKIEGGANEDVRLAASTYVLNCTIRGLKGRKKPIPDKNGVVAHTYAVALVPEDPACYGILIERSQPSVTDTFSTEDGILWAYAFDALDPASGDKDQVQIGVISLKNSSNEITTSDDDIETIECKEVEPTEDGE